MLLHGSSSTRSRSGAPPPRGPTTAPSACSRPSPAPPLPVPLALPPRPARPRSATGGGPGDTVRTRRSVRSPPRTPAPPSAARCLPGSAASSSPPRPLRRRRTESVARPHSARPPSPALLAGGVRRAHRRICGPALWDLPSVRPWRTARSGASVRAGPLLTAAGAACSPPAAARSLVRPSLTRRGERIRSPRCVPLSTWPAFLSPSKSTLPQDPAFVQQNLVAPQKWPIFHVLRR